MHIRHLHSCMWLRYQSHTCIIMAGQDKTHFFSCMSDPDLELWLAALGHGVEQPPQKTPGNSCFYEVCHHVHLPCQRESTWALTGVAYHTSFLMHAL